MNIKLFNIFNFGVQPDMTIEEVWKIRGLNISNAAVWCLLTFVLTWRLVVFEETIQEPIIQCFFPFLLISFSILLCNYFNYVNLGYYIIIFGNWSAMVIMIYLYGYFYQITIIYTLIAIGAIFLFNTNYVIQIFTSLLCALSIIFVNFTLQKNIPGLDRFNAHETTFPLLNTINDVVYMSVIVGIVAYGQYFALLYKNLTEAHMRSIEAQKLSIEAQNKSIEAQNKSIEAQNKSLKESKDLIEKQASELKKLDLAKSRFFANVSHELRTPITLILGPLKKVLNSKGLTVKNHELLRFGYQNSEKLLDLVDEILDLTKLENHTLQLNKSSNDLRVLVQQIADDFQMMAEMQKKSLTVKIKLPNTAHFEIDEKKVRIVIKNLLSNAFKFTKENDKINLEFIYEKGIFTTIVEDTGRGIHSNDLPNIFKRFYQSIELDTKAEGGAGIGLSLSHQYVKLMEGEISVNSVLGEGTTFKVDLPVELAVAEIPKNVVEIKNEVIKEEPPVEALYKNSIFTKPRILVVEDNLSICSFLETILKPNYELEIVHNGKEAIAFLKYNAFAIDLILSDIMMPELDGYQLLNYVKSSAAYRHIPTIMLTARIDIKDKLRALRAGVDDYLTKPFSEEELLVRINNMILNYRARLTYINTLETKEETEAESLLSLNISQEDQAWIDQLEASVNESIDDFNLTIETLAYKMCISRPQLFRRIKSLIGMTPMDYIREVRFKKAHDLLESKKYSTVKAVSYSVGFKSERNFARNFKKRFGRYPSEYL